MVTQIQKRIAAKVMKCSPKRIKLDPTKLEEIKEAITKHDVKLLLGTKAIKTKQKKGVSRARANKALKQKRKGLRKGHGSRKGTLNARAKTKRTWINKIRKQRALIKRLYENKKIDTTTYRELYKKSKGNFFRSARHIKVYLEEHGILKNEKK
ncbi:50S ribosomal protein L19e [Candidatus Woesearchaeota archaeon]|jgi:large subunit ribosomal protein L19e|nr:50S ribosomal protein L19e [Candidatus Woesearchaeota archaeon]MBT4368702.1 50S ribosomal protein L19e [Candidatus Woesearchaeota archaeon]MBT4711991.1 50S ribosomal protein L19e [Candidatus Woesearchaeota archaeon]MBT6638886.1 50S ribosomal protein L19e [Candidatus Woesearchaeota archaeon]MBT7134530.1 50S ribosomal protein L19e [Candidatus Woesearchaeota archaeon]